MKALGFEITRDEIQALFRMFAEGWKRIYVPKNKKNRIGIVIAIQTENNKEKIILKNDFVNELQRYLGETRLSQSFYTVIFPEQLANKIKGREDSDIFLRRARAHFMLSGSLVRRKVGGQDNYVFKLFGFVRHRPVPLKVSQDFSKEFSEVLPQRITFSETDELIGFDTTKQWVYLVIQYIISIAAYVSFDFDLALELLRKLETDLSNIGPNQKSAPIVTLLQSKVPKWKMAVLGSYLQRQYLAFSFTRDWQYIESLENKVSELENISPESYQAKLVRAMILFRKGRVQEAINVFQDEKSLPREDVTWRYSMGFLFAFMGNAKEAWEQYRRAFYGKTSPNVVNDTEIFISEVINEHPEKPQLIYFRGLINYHAKGDISLAEQDFALFLEKSSKDQMQDLRSQAEKYLSEISRYI